MKRLRSSLLLLLLFTSVNSFANPTQTFDNLTGVMGIRPNNGSGDDNVGASVSGSQVEFSLGGFTGGDWFGTQGYTPGTGGGGDTGITFDTVFFGMIGSQIFDNTNSMAGIASFFAGTFTFPTNGKNFTVTVPASIGTIPVFLFTTGNTVELNTVPGDLTFSFTYDPFFRLYFPNQATFASTPEPGTLALLTIAFGLVPWRLYKRI